MALDSIQINVRVPPEMLERLDMIRYVQSLQGRPAIVMRALTHYIECMKNDTEFMTQLEAAAKARPHKFEWNKLYELSQSRSR